MRQVALGLGNTVEVVPVYHSLLRGYLVVRVVHPCKRINERFVAEAETLSSLGKAHATRLNGIAPLAGVARVSGITRMLPRPRCGGEHCRRPIVALQCRFSGCSEARRARVFAALTGSTLPAACFKASVPSVARTRSINTELFCINPSRRHDICFPQPEYCAQYLARKGRGRVRR